MSPSNKPKVSIGLPVYNGENYLSVAIESILTQSFSDFELILSDNASNDTTEQICRSYSESDGRVRYVRNKENIGAGPNFNQVYKLSRGQYFKWAAHDDLLEPTFVERCVTILDLQPDVVLCHSFVKEIDQFGEENRYGHRPMVGADHHQPHRRYAVAVLGAYSCTEIFGLIRSDVLRQIPLHEGSKATDRIILSELALRGRIVHVPEKLFCHRDHQSRFVHVALKERANRIAWYGPNEPGRPTNDGVALCRSYIRVANRSAPNYRQRLACYWHVLRWPTVKKNYILLLTGRPYESMDPRFKRIAKTIKHWFTRPFARGR